jgi:hypothetical protein
MQRDPGGLNGPEPLWGGSGLVAWVREGGIPPRPSPLLACGRAKAFDLSRWLQERLPPLPPMPDNPVFILGMWRSGTTLAHEMLAALDGSTTPHSWECFRPSTLRLLAPPRLAPGIARPMDDAVISASSPQEDEFALLLLGENSLYRGFLDPRRLPELQALLAPVDDDRWLPAFETFMRGVQATRPGRLIIKSPNHLFRIVSIARRYPRAAFLVTLRHPSTIYWSNVRMWQAMTRLYGHWPAPDGVIEGFVIAAMNAAALHLDTLRKLKEQGVFVATCRFEALVVNPVKIIGGVLPILGMDAGTAVIASLQLRAGALMAIPRTEFAPLPPAVVEAGRRLEIAQSRLEESC